MITIVMNGKRVEYKLNDFMELIFKLSYLEELSNNKIAEMLGIHRNTVSKYVNILRSNLSILKTSITEKGICSEKNIDLYIASNWISHIDAITKCSHKVRPRNARTDKIIRLVLDVSNNLGTKSPTTLYYYFRRHMPGCLPNNSSITTIWKILRDHGES